MKPERHWGTPTGASVALVAHRLLSFAMRYNDDIDWHVHSLMLPFHDLRGFPLRRPPFFVPRKALCSAAFRVDRHLLNSDEDYKNDLSRDDFDIALGQEAHQLLQPGEMSVTKLGNRCRHSACNRW